MNRINVLFPTNTITTPSTLSLNVRNKLLSVTSYLANKRVPIVSVNCTVNEFEHISQLLMIYKSILHCQYLISCCIQIPTTEDMVCCTQPSKTYSTEMGSTQNEPIQLSPSVLAWLLSSHIFGLSSCVILFVLAIYRFYYSKANISINTKSHIRIISMLNIICYILFYIANILSDYVYYQFMDGHNTILNILYYFCIVLAIISATAAPLLFFILMIIRLKITFEGTIYANDKWVFKIYWIGNILMAIIWIIVWIKVITPILNFYHDLLDL